MTSVGIMLLPALALSAPPAFQPRELSTVGRLLSPYRRPLGLQPRRLAAEAYALYGEAFMGLPVGRLGVDIEIRDTQTRGKGLFALRSFEPGELVARYSGVICTRAEFREAWRADLTDGVYAIKASSDGEIVMDAEDPATSGAGRYVNHSRLWCNCAFRSFTNDDEGLEPSGVCYIQTTRAVAAGSEFLFDYGADYWSGSEYNWLTRLATDYLP